MKSHALAGIYWMVAAFVVLTPAFAAPSSSIGNEREIWASRLETHADAADSRRRSLGETYGIISNELPRGPLNLPGIDNLKKEPQPGSVFYGANASVRSLEPSKPSVSDYAGGAILDDVTRDQVRRRKYLDDLSMEMTRLRGASANLRDIAEAIRTAPTDEEALSIAQKAEVPLTTVEIIGQPVLGTGANLKPVRVALTEADKVAEESSDQRLRKALIATEDPVNARITLDGEEGFTRADALIATSPSILARMNLATVDYPSVGSLMYDFDGEGLKPICTGTLISEDAFLTAAHCFCKIGSSEPGAKVVTNDPDKYNFTTHKSCMAASYKRGDQRKSIRPDNPEGHYVYFQHAGLIEADRILINDEYNFGLNQGDLAVVYLKKPVINVRPARINTDMAFRNNASGTIVGFGARNVTDEKGKPIREVSYSTTGLKYRAPVNLQPCEGGYAGRRLLCWNYVAMEGLDVGTSCKGDSGGPLFIDVAQGWEIGTNQPKGTVDESGEMVLVGVISAGPRDGCLTSGQSINVDVQGYPWITKVVPNAATTKMGLQVFDDGRLDPVYNNMKKRLALYDSNGVFGDNAMPEPRYVQAFKLEKAAKLLMVTINGTISDGHPGSFGLRVLHESGFMKDCIKRGKDLAYACPLIGEAGNWEIQVLGSRPREFQLIVTPHYATVSSMFESPAAQDTSIVLAKQ